MTDIAINPRISCRYCPPGSKVIYDGASGSVICIGCATVLEDHCFDEGREWRVFASEGVDSQANTGRERADVTSTIDQGTSEGGGTLIVGAGPKAQRLQMKLRSAQNATKPELSAEQKEDKSIQHFTEKARDVARRLSLGEEIVNRCTMLLQDLAAKKLLKSSYQTPWYCALVEIACEEEPFVQKTVHDFAYAHRHQIASKVEMVQLKRTEGTFGAVTATFNQAAVVKELKGQVIIGKMQVTLTPSQANSLLIRWQGDRDAVTEEMLEEYFSQQLDDLHQKKCVAAITKQYDALCCALDRARAHYFETEDLYKSYVQSLGLAAEVVKPAKHIASKAVQKRLVRTAKDLNERFVVTGAMASAIFIVAWLLDVEKKPRLEDVAKAAKVSEGYAKMTYSSIRKEITKLLPEGYLKRYISRVQTLPPPENVSRKRPADFPAGM